MQGRRWLGWVTQGGVVIVAMIVALALVGVAPQWTQRIRAWDRALLETSRTAQVAPTRRRPAALGPSVRTLMRPLGRGLVLGYLYDPNGTAEALDQLSQLVPVVTGIACDWYTVSSAGELSGQTQPQVMAFAAGHHLTTLAVVEQTDPTVLSQLLQSPSAEAISMNQMLTMVESDGFDGVNLDWEGMPASDRTRFSQYVQGLTHLFHQHGFYVTLSLPAETSNQPQNSWTGAYDYQVLGREADLLMIMAYDQHWAGGPPGPIASPSWVRSVLSFSISQVAPEKLILGIPGYGYDWSGEGAVALTFSQAQALEQAYAPKSDANHFQYVQDGALHSVWFENTQSFLASVQLVSGFELRGIVLWRIGIEDPKIWDFLE